MKFKVHLFKSNFAFKIFVLFALILFIFFPNFLIYSLSDVKKSNISLSLQNNDYNGIKLIIPKNYDYNITYSDFINIKDEKFEFIINISSRKDYNNISFIFQIDLDAKDFEAFYWKDSEKWYLNGEWIQIESDRCSIESSSNNTLFMINWNTMEINQMIQLKITGFFIKENNTFTIFTIILCSIILCGIIGIILYKKRGKKKKIKKKKKEVKASNLKSVEKRVNFIDFKDLEDLDQTDIIFFDQKKGTLINIDEIPDSIYNRFKKKSK